MNREETKAIMVVIGNAFPTSKFANFDSEMVDTWAFCLQDVPYEVGRAAAMAGLMTGDFPPTINQIRGRIASASMGEVLTAEQAWGKIMKAVRMYGWCNPKGAEAFLGPFIWSVVKSFEWRYFCELDLEKESTYVAQFRTAYNALLVREKEKMQIPQEVQVMLGSVVASQGKIGDGK